MPFNPESAELSLVSIRGKGGEDWYLNENVYYFDPESNTSVYVKKGMLTDLASIPGWARFLISNDDYRIRRPAIIHDSIYYTKGKRQPFMTNGKCYPSKHIKRKHADQIFYRALLEEGLDTFRAKLMYWAVRIGGKSAWND